MEPAHQHLEQTIARGRVGIRRQLDRRRIDAAAECAENRRLRPEGAIEIDEANPGRGRDVGESQPAPRTVGRKRQGRIDDGAVEILRRIRRLGGTALRAAGLARHDPDASLPRRDDHRIIWQHASGMARSIARDWVGQDTAITAPPVRRTRSSNASGKTAWGWPAAAQISSWRLRSRSMNTIGGWR